MNNKMISELFDTSGYNNTFRAVKFIMNYQIMREIGGFLSVEIRTDRKNWTCKSCGKKLNQLKQIYTLEPGCPVYHIECYMRLHDIVMQILSSHKSEVESSYASLEVSER